MIRLKACLALVGLACSSVAQAQEIGCSDAVAFNGPVIEVSAVSGDDSENIQCALDVAAADGYREVLLVSSEYSIGEIAVDRFVGDLKGKSSDLTRLTVTNGAVSCSNEAPGAVLKFNGGSPSVRNLALSASEPCANGNSVSLIVFSGESANCSRRTVFGTVDRVAISGAGSDGADVVVGVSADTALDCDFATQQINGSLAVNRVAFNNLDFAVISAMGNASAAAVTFNSFSEVGLAVSIVDARQDTNIFRNTFNYNDVQGYGSGAVLGGTAVFVASTELSPRSNSTSIKDNTFNDGGLNDGSIAILSGQSGSSINHSILISGNTFNGSKDNVLGTGIAVLDTPGGLVSGNLFRDGGSWIQVASGELGEAVDGWAIVGNDFSRSAANPDIDLGTNAIGNIVGRSQSFPIVTETISGDNDILESAATMSSFGNSEIIRQAKQKVESQLQAQPRRNLRLLAR